MVGSSGGLNLRVSTVQALDWRDWEKVQISVSADTLWAAIWTRSFSLIQSRSFLPLALLLKWLNLSGDTNILTRGTDFQECVFRVSGHKYLKTEVISSQALIKYTRIYGVTTYKIYITVVITVNFVLFELTE